MFLKSIRWYTKDGSQRASGSFLALFSPSEGTQETRRELRGLVRHVVLHQCGHFMMGSIRVSLEPRAEPLTISLSGAYGHDGLPLAPPVELWERLHPLPAHLVEAYWAGGGHNSAGSEAGAVHEWALANRMMLSRLK